MEFPERCNLKLNPVEQDPFPAFPVPDGLDLDGYFEQMCRTRAWRKRMATDGRSSCAAGGYCGRQIEEYRGSAGQREIDCIQADEVSRGTS